MLCRMTDASLESVVKSGWQNGVSEGVVDQLNGDEVIIRRGKISQTAIFSPQSAIRAPCGSRRAHLRLWRSTLVSRPQSTSRDCDKI